MYKISIIIPVYNVKNYIRMCLDSIINQNYDNYEIIIIDDGSNDGSEKIIDEYSKKCNNITAIHKKNEGPAIARNVGIQYASGEYIIFLDSDDMLEKESLKKINNLITLKTADVFLGQMYKILFPKGLIKDRVNKICFDDRKNNILKNILKHSTVSITYIWRNIYNTKFIKENSIYFQDGILCAEDLDWNMRVYSLAKKIDIIDFYTHIYRGNRKGSIVTECSFNRVYDFYLIVEKWLNIANNTYDSELRLLIKNFFSKGFYTNLKYIYNFEKNDRITLKKKIENGEFWNYPVTKENKRIFNLKKLLGLNIVLIYLNIKFRIIVILKNIAIKLNIIDR